MMEVGYDTQVHTIPNMLNLRHSASKVLVLAKEALNRSHGFLKQQRGDLDLDKTIAFSGLVFTVNLTRQLHFAPTFPFGANQLFQIREPILPTNSSIYTSVNKIRFG
jgi:hypothetical protein